LTKSGLVAIVVTAVDKEGNAIDVQGMPFNWSAEVQSIKLNKNKLNTRLYPNYTRIG